MNQQKQNSYYQRAIRRWFGETGSFVTSKMTKGFEAIPSQYLIKSVTKFHVELLKTNAPLYVEEYLKLNEKVFSQAKHFTDFLEWFHFMKYKIFIHEEFGTTKSNKQLRKETAQNIRTWIDENPERRQWKDWLRFHLINEGGKATWFLSPKMTKAKEIPDINSMKFTRNMILERFRYTYPNVNIKLKKAMTIAIEDSLKMNSFQAWRNHMKHSFCLSVLYHLESSI